MLNYDFKNALTHSTTPENREKRGRVRELGVHGSLKKNFGILT